MGPSLSADGKILSFASAASDLVEGDTNGIVSGADVFVRDLAAQTTERVNVTSQGLQSSGTATNPAVSGDGRYITFLSTGDDLTPSETNGYGDAYLFDRLTGTTTNQSVASDGTEADRPTEGKPAITAHGKNLVIATAATNLELEDNNLSVDIYLRRPTAPTTQKIGAGSLSSISADGSKIAYVGWYGRLYILTLAPFGGENEYLTDSDGDGLTDAEEDGNLNHTVDTGETDPLLADTDGDGYDDRTEIIGGTNPLDFAETP